MPSRFHQILYVLKRRVGYKGSIFIILAILLLLQIWQKDALKPIRTNEMIVYAGGRTYTRYSPLIFVGGMPRSGTTLMRTLLDAHPDIRCGAETYLLNSFLQSIRDWFKNEDFMFYLRKAEITQEVILTAGAHFALGIIANHGAASPKILCDKDLYVVTRIKILSVMFPNAKFLLMIRDGRAVIHSIITQNVAVKYFNHSNQAEALESWNRVMTDMVSECRSAGPRICMMVFYEQLVLHPEMMTKKIFNFLEIEWSPDIMRHEEIIKAGNEIHLSSVERSTKQVSRAIHIGPLTRWFAWIDPEVYNNTARLAPLMVELGYNVSASEPYYGEPDAKVLEDSERVERERNATKYATTTEKVESSAE